MSIDIFDIAYDPTAKLDSAKAAGIHTIIGYISSISPHGAKCWTPDRMRKIAAAGMLAGIVHEGYGGTKGQGVSAADGRRDGPFAVTQFPVLGAPRGASCFFACDVGYSASDVSRLVLPYFEAIGEAFKNTGYRVGIYGDGASCAAVMDRGLAAVSWLANATSWPGYRDFLPRADIVQHLPSHVAGLEVDTDTAKPGVDLGFFTPFSGKTASAPILVTVDKPGIVSGARALLSHWLHPTPAPAA